MSDDLKDKLIKAFPGKMENKQAFLMTFVMETAQKGETPPSKNELERVINEMISAGTFEEKGDLLILNTSVKPRLTEDDQQPPTPVELNGDFTVIQNKIIAAFQGKFEKRTALVMTVVMNEVSKGNQPPTKDEIEKEISELVEKGKLEEKGDTLIKL